MGFLYLLAGLIHKLPYIFLFLPHYGKRIGKTINAGFPVDAYGFDSRWLRVSFSQKEEA